MALQKELQLHCSKMSLSYLQNTDLINVQGNKMAHIGQNDNLYCQGNRLALHSGKFPISLIVIKLHCIFVILIKYRHNHCSQGNKMELIYWQRNGFIVIK